MSSHCGSDNAQACFSVTVQLVVPCLIDDPDSDQSIAPIMVKTDPGSCH